MRRLILAAVLALAGLSLAVPAQASHYGFPHPKDIKEVRSTPSSISQVYWRATNTGLDSCEIDVQNKRSGGHTIRVEVARDDIKAVLFSQKFWVPAGSTLGVWPALASEPLSAREYVRWKWDDNATWAVLNLYAGQNTEFFYDYPTWTNC